MSGVNDVQIRIYYTDGEYDVYYESNRVYKTVIYELEDNEIVDFVWFWNIEMWNAGNLYVDYVGVNY